MNKILGFFDKIETFILRYKGILLIIFGCALITHLGYISYGFTEISWELKELQQELMMQKVVDNLDEIKSAITYK
ncbi:hypothetical protein [Acinetobacter haemolyticus]|uniref:hypothetical protein n=1 Tax=Acinetobacter haemolyticus TaxID=29430 RepID=UPI00325BE753